MFVNTVLHYPILTGSNLAKCTTVKPEQVLSDTVPPSNEITLASLISGLAACSARQSCQRDRGLFCKHRLLLSLDSAIGADNSSDGFSRRVGSGLNSSSIEQLNKGRLFLHAALPQNSSLTQGVFITTDDVDRRNREESEKMRMLQKERDRRSNMAAVRQTTSFAGLLDE